MKRFGLKCVAALGLLVAVSPAFVLIGAKWAPGAGAHWALWGLLAAVLGVVCGLPGGKRRYLSGALGLLLLAAMAFSFMPGGPGLLLGVPAAAVYGMVLGKAAFAPFDEFGPRIWWTCGGLHIAGILLARLLEFPEAATLQTGLLLAYVPVFLLHLNRSALYTGVSLRGGTRPPRRIRRGNLWLTLLVSLLVLVIANIGPIWDAFAAALRWLGRGIGQILRWFANLLAEDTGPVTSGGSVRDMLPAAEAAETAPIWVVLEKVMMGVAFLLLLLLAGFALWKLFRGIRRLTARLAERMRGALNALGEGVRDQTESIFDWEELRGAARLRVEKVRKRLARPARWQDMDNRQRVRFVYGQAVGKKPDTPAVQTAREVLRTFAEGERMADIYDAARYSEQPIAEADAVFMRDAIGRRKGS